MSSIAWEYQVVERPFCEQLQQMGWEWIDVTPSRVKVSDLGFRWGSCGKNHIVHFNWRVLLCRSG
jgi:predicted metal-dependent hydrolase